MLERPFPPGRPDVSGPRPTAQSSRSGAQSESPGPLLSRHQTPEGRRGRARLAAQAASQVAPRPCPSSGAELCSPAGAAQPRSKQPPSGKGPSRVLRDSGGASGLPPDGPQRATVDRGGGALADPS
ncbi:hypothetical protein NDU88_002273 [Pleurodeles waltl]|uniref:Uncharacterized protein n=1 Tax=Pleurodeles waltl TaxID=8319 RepID=A0AAV7TK31_PLEWA|nr:hypothetical protein NDU88_002273 [Pleurodeles waltl]